MQKITSRQQKIIEIIKNSESSFAEIFKQFGDDVVGRTIKRDLADLVESGILKTQGGGRSVVYILPLSGRFFLPIDETIYSELEPDHRNGVLSQYQFDVWNVLPSKLFSKTDYDLFEKQTAHYREQTEKQSADIRARELERFVIELSWKSSRIEGNTYTLLDTERLLKEGIPSPTNSKEETQMILNHKTAFDFVREQTPDAQMLVSRAYIEHVHTLLMKDLLTDSGLRKSTVGITGSTYRPLATVYQIEEALEALISKINACEGVFDKALVALIGISYIQPFVDGNKRTARLVANGILLAGQCAPLSYRNVDERQYRAALLAFYEQLSVVPMRNIFREQYVFAVENYS
jgi:Fic family protein